MDTLTTAVAYPRPSDWLFSDDPMLSRENVTVLAGSGAVRTIKAGEVVGRASKGAVTFAATGGNTGNGVLTLDVTTPKLAGAIAGAYTVRAIAAAANSGTFRVFDPQGDVLGDVVVGATFSNQVKFVIADGATDFIVGDSFTITVADGTLQVKALDTAALDGSEVAWGIMYDTVTAKDGATTKGVVVVRDAVYIDSGLIWPAGISAANKAAAIGALLAQHVVPRVGA